MSNILSDSVSVGLITLIIGIMAVKITSNNEITLSKYINITFFIIGFVIHATTEYIGFNKFYCNRTCRKSLEILKK